MRLQTLLTTLLVSSACSPTTASQPKHDLKAPVRDASSWNWNSATTDDYAQIMAPLLGLDPKTILPQSHPIVQRAQFWLDQIDASLRAKYPTELANVPKPQATVLKVGVPNAFVAPVPTCYDVPVEIGTPGVLSGGGKVFIDVKTGALAAWPAELKCKDGSGDPSRTGLAVVTAFAQKFNASSTTCKYSVTASGSLKPTAACVTDPDAAALGVSSGVVLMETANFVTVHSGILTIMPEADFVSVLAHELGHYYRSHGTAAKSDYDFFYTLTPNEPDHKPLAEADKSAVGAAAVVASGLLSAADNFAAVAGQQLRSDLFLTVGSLVTQVAALDGAPSACTTASTLITGADFKATMGLFPFAKAGNPEQVTAYQAYETQSLACLAALAFSDHGGVSSSSLGFDALQAAAAQPTWPAFLTALSPAGQSRLARVNKIVAARLGEQAPAAATARDAVLALNAGFAAQDQQSLSALNVAHDQHLGEYTIEQEADDESAEWIAGLGIDPAAGVDSMRSLGKGMKASLGGNILAQSDCDRLWQTGWVNTDGSYSYVPLGNLTDPHHSVCYRMFNIDREIKAHHLVAAAVSVPTPTGPSWTELQTLATSLVPPVALDASFAGKPHVSSFVAKTGAMSCSYAYSYSDPH